MPVDAAPSGWHRRGVQTGRPSLTALSAARHRAVHQVLDRAAIFVDPLAVPVAGFASPSEAVASARTDQMSTAMRWFISARSRFAEDVVAEAVASGVRQVIVLGAGLDTLAYRRPLPPQVRVFEVDHPDTQAWKRQRLAAVGVPEPDHVTFVAVDLETEDLTAALRDAGVRDDGSVVLWLGVLPYLTLDAIRTTLTALAGLGPVDVVLDYGEPVEDRDAEARRAYEERAARVAALGEPWVTFLAPERLREVLAGCGLGVVEDVDAVAYIRRLLGRPDDGRRSPAHLVHARRR